MVYTEIQRVELEKEFLYSKYITIKRKSELSSTLSLSERQIKIWFQNRRAKDRKSNRKHKSDQKSSNSHQINQLHNQQQQSSSAKPSSLFCPGLYKNALSDNSEESEELSDSDEEVEEEPDSDEEQQQQSGDEHDSVSAARSLLKATTDNSAKPSRTLVKERTSRRQSAASRASGEQTANGPHHNLSLYHNQCHNQLTPPPPAASISPANPNHSVVFTASSLHAAQQPAPPSTNFAPQFSSFQYTHHMPGSSSSSIFEQQQQQPFQYSCGNETNSASSSYLNHQSGFYQPSPNMMSMGYQSGSGGGQMMYQTQFQAAAAVAAAAAASQSVVAGFGPSVDYANFMNSY